MTKSTKTPNQVEAGPTAQLVKVGRLVKCDNCDRPAEYIESLPALSVGPPRLKCEKHRPIGDKHHITFGIYMGNKY